MFYNTLLTNLRLLAKMQSVTWGLCVFDCVNKIICYKCCRKPCQDRCLTPWTLLKWVIKGIWLGITISAVRNKVEEWDDKTSYNIVEYEARFKTRLDTYLTIYLCQLPIFFVARCPIFCIYSCFTCCCTDTGPEQQEVNVGEMKHLLVSYDYV